ncbi:plasminogen activator inhibitor 1 RNA-binding protein [Hippocampus comes]|uniref:plasminogen activator inhibitor 1 RNA-binding protein n=1 Tax=Hippocampus comes TaxID=109280 RepID=UPI00094EDC36|nr:PREDICTED: plasminogen activator inhibitor 1 RNA-binding protein-like [Hippocampus comes]
MPGHLQEGFGCVVTNRFDQLPDDESDPSEILKAAENKKKEGAAAGSAKSAAQAAKQPKKESQKDRKNPLVEKKDESQPPVALKKDGVRRVGRRPEQQPGHQGSQHHGGQVEGRLGDKRPDRRPPRERRFEKPAEGDGPDFSADKPSGDRPPRGRGGGRGGRGGRGRGMGRGEGFDSRGKRDFDRHSGTDKSNPKSEEKRSGAGSHNWGNVKEEASEAQPTPAPATEKTPEGEEQAPAGSENKENEVEEVKPEGPREMTLDEWKAMQDKERTKVEFNIRKANEGADSQWKKGYVLHKSKSEDGTGDESADHHFRKPANDITSQLEINFGDLGRPGRGRGGPRGGRGGRGGGGSRPARGGGRAEKASGVSVPNVDDPEAFPALA